MPPRRAPVRKRAPQRDRALGRLALPDDPVSEQDETTPPARAGRRRRGGPPSPRRRAACRDGRPRTSRPSGARDAAAGARRPRPSPVRRRSSDGSKIASATVQNLPSMRSRRSARLSSLERLARPVDVRNRAEGVAREPGERGRLEALAADIADERDPPAVAELEHVVEVASDLVPGDRRQEQRRDVDPRNDREAPAVGGSPEAYRGPVSLAVEPRVLHRPGDPSRHLPGEADVVFVVRIDRQARRPRAHPTWCRRS